MPPLPQTRDEIDLSGEWSLTNNDERFLLHQDENMIIFSTDKCLERLAQTETIFMDGTFKAAPHLFLQLCTIHGVYLENFVSLV